MNVKHFVAAIATVIVTGSAIAQQMGPYGDPSDTKSVKSRAEVTRELRTNAAYGDYFVAAHEFVDPRATVVSSRTREQIRSDLQLSRADGSYALAHRDYVDPAAAFASAFSRARVVAELRQSRKDGSYALVHQEYLGQFPRPRSNASFRLARSGSTFNAN